jgi:hypothetical protein
VFGRRGGDQGVIDGDARDAEFREPGVESLCTLSAEESRAGEVMREQPGDRVRGAAVGRWHSGQHRESLECRVAAETATAIPDGFPCRLVVLVTGSDEGYGDAGVDQELRAITAGRHRGAFVLTRR